MRSIREFLIGSPIPTQRQAQERLSNAQALAAFSPDALSSIGYANQEIFLGLALAGAAGLAFSLEIGLAITALLVIVALSYSQTLRAYPTGGGSYSVARANLGPSASLIAAAALQIGYVVTAAVSLTAGVQAIASAFPALWPHRVVISLALLAIITLANLRGLRESGTLMAIPVYFFLASYLGMLAYGGVRALLEGPGSFAVTAPQAVQPLGILLILNAFASGCTALTGIEAISNGVPSFKPPEWRNARQTLTVMALLMGTLFLGSIGLTQYFAVVAGSQETILSTLARRILGSGAPYMIVQAGTLLILTVAANTSFAGFPRLTSVLAQDGYVPRQLSSVGDRLVFSNGMVVLAVLAGGLIVLFGGDTHALIPLFAVGVFLAFTLSQAGMVVHWFRERGPGWVWKALVNGLGTAATAAALLVVGLSKFLAGAWIVFVLVPLLAAAFGSVKRHYAEVSRELSLSGLPPSLKPMPSPRVVVPISGVHRGVVESVRFARSISDRVTAVYVEITPGAAGRVRAEWENWGQGVPLVVVPSPYRSIVGPLLEFVDQTDREHNDGQLATIVIPQFVAARGWQDMLHNQTAWLLRVALLYRRRRFGQIRAVVDVPFYLKR